MWPIGHCGALIYIVMNITLSQFRQIHSLSSLNLCIQVGLFCVRFLACTRRPFLCHYHGLSPPPTQPPAADRQRMSCALVWDISGRPAAIRACTSGGNDHGRRHRWLVSCIKIYQNAADFGPHMLFQCTCGAQDSISDHKYHISK